ncbi:MAG: zonular occludens toxin domain-containing protein [Clostridium sp.]|nr:zonular occludens toxin domain-containing protein [Clostridium sp.]
MIYFYTGVPGSGKGVHSSEVIYKMLQSGKDVITNIDVHTELIEPRRKKPVGNCIYVPTQDWLHDAFIQKPKQKEDRYSYLQGLYGYANNYHLRKADGSFFEHQTWLVLDEVQELFNTRTWNRRDRLAWCAFFREHRKYGYDCILISQDDKNVDKQIRTVLQKQVLHRKVTDYKFFGKVLKLLTGRDLFIAISTQYGMKKADAKTGTRFYFGRQKYYDFYDSMQTFRDSGM